MYSKQEENLILYQKSKHKITIHLILYFFILCVYFFAMAYLFSSMEFLKVDDPAFRSMLIKLGSDRFFYMASHLFFFQPVKNGFVFYIG